MKYIRRKFRSQTSDDMDRWKAEMGRVNEEKRRDEKRREEKKKEDQRREIRTKKIQVRERVGKSRFTVFLKWCVAPEGRKVGSLKRPVRSHVARWEKKVPRRCGAKHISKSKCTKHTILRPLLEVEMLKSARCVARSTFPSQNVKSTTLSDRFWTFRCRFAWQAQGIAHLVKSEQNVRIFVAFPKTMAGVGHLKVHFPWQAQYKRHVHQRC